ncbi:MAG: helix-turn-helix domain-containing protein, partial [Acidimicrobiales bacterium]
MLVHQAYRFEMDPNNTARSALASHAGAARFAYNWGLATVIERLDAHRALSALAVRQGAGADEAKSWATELVRPVPWRLPALRREWNAAKSEVAPWWAQNSKESYNSGLDALARALKGFFDSRSGAREGPRVGFPRFHERGARRSFRVTTGAFGVVNDRHVRLPRIGVIRTKEPTAELTAVRGAG